MTSQEVVFLEGKQVVLRPLDKATDLEFCQRWINDPGVRHFLMNAWPLSLEQEAKWFDGMINDKSNIHPFYVEAKEYAGFVGKTQLSTGIKEIQNVPPYSIKIPDAKLIKALKIIQEMDGKVTKKQMAELAEKNNLISINPKDEEHRSMVRFTSLDKNIIQPLEEWGFVTVNKLGRNRWINVTEEGKNASEFLI